MICRVELYTELFYASIPTLFPCFLLICYPYIFLQVLFMAIIHVIMIIVTIAPLLLEQIGLGPGALMIFLVYYFKWLLN